MQELESKQEQLTAYFASLGVDRFACADLRPHQEHLHQEYGNKWDDYPFAVVFAVHFPTVVVDELLQGPNHHYLAHYEIINARLNDIVLQCANHLEEMGYRAYPVPASLRTGPDKLAGVFSHRLGARLAGIGWIGKSCNLITPDRGPRLRFATVLTDAPVSCGVPIENMCRDCHVCEEACPVHAIKGVAWAEDQDISERLDVVACDQYHTYMRHSFGKRTCGICYAVCPYGRKYKK